MPEVQPILFYCENGQRTTFRKVCSRVCRVPSKIELRWIIWKTELVLEMRCNWTECWYHHLIKKKKEFKRCLKWKYWYSLRIDFLPFKNFWAPSRHSGESSLSPKDPNNSETRMSAFSGAFQSRISQETMVTRSPHSSSDRACKLLKKNVLISLTRLKSTVDLSRVILRDNSVGIFLDSVNANLTISLFSSRECCSNQRTSSSTNYH